VENHLSDSPEPPIGPLFDSGSDSLRRCPFVRAVAADRLDEAWRLALAPPEPLGPAETGVFVWLVAEARRQLAGSDSTGGIA